MLPVIYRPAAEFELQEAHNWYEEREPGLGSEFMRCVDSCIQLIRRHPEIFPVAHRNIRQAVVRRFPYSIFYFPANETIIVVSVFHASRQPKRWERPERFT
jgi:plasmid stabilization system protein ParE